MDKEMTASEQAAEKQRKADLAAELERKDKVELGLLAKKIGVPGHDKLHTRKDLIAAIEEKADADAAAGRQKIRDMEAEEGRFVAGQDDSRPQSSRVLRALNAEFCRDIPQEGRAGTFEPEDNDARFGGDYDAPDGKYRVVGSDWIFEIKGKKLASAIRASEQNRYGGRDVESVD